MSMRKNGSLFLVFATLAAQPVFAGDEQFSSLMDCTYAPRNETKAQKMERIAECYPLTNQGESRKPLVHRDEPKKEELQVTPAPTSYEPPAGQTRVSGSVQVGNSYVGNPVTGKQGIEALATVAVQIPLNAQPNERLKSLNLLATGAGLHPHSPTDAPLEFRLDKAAAEMAWINPLRQDSGNNLSAARATFSSDPSKGQVFEAAAGIAGQLSTKPLKTTLNPTVPFSGGLNVVTTGALEVGAAQYKTGQNLTRAVVRVNVDQLMRYCADLSGEAEIDLFCVGALVNLKIGSEIAGSANLSASYVHKLRTGRNTDPLVLYLQPSITGEGFKASLGDSSEQGKFLIRGGVNARIGY